jgi:hypothetical protein
VTEDTAPNASEGQTGVVTNLPARRRDRSLVSKADDLLLVGVVAVAAVLALQVVGWVIGTIVFLIKLAIVAAIVAAGVVWYRSRRS